MLLTIQEFFFFSVLLIYFTLQYCIGFAIHWHESPMRVHDLNKLEAVNHILTLLLKWNEVGQSCPTLCNLCGL